MGQCVGVKVNINFAAVIRIYIQNLEQLHNKLTFGFKSNLMKCSSATVEVINETTTGQFNSFPFLICQIYIHRNIGLLYHAVSLFQSCSKKLLGFCSSQLYRAQRLHLLEFTIHCAPTLTGSEKSRLYIFVESSMNINYLGFLIQWDFPYIST